MHIAKISAPVFCLVWHFFINIPTIIIAFTIFQKVEDSPLKKTFLAFSIVSVVVYGAIAAPMFVYSYKYGTSPDNRNGRLLSGISVMFMLSSVPMVVTMLIMVLQNIYIEKYSLFILLFALHSIAFAVGLFISWFAYMRSVAAAFHRWRGPERQIPPQGLGNAGMVPGVYQNFPKDFPDKI